MGKAHFQSEMSDILKRINVKDVTMNMNIAAFLTTLSRHQQKTISEIMGQVRNNYNQLQNQNTTAWECTSIPLTYPRMRTVYLDGKHALLPNVPYPKAHKLDENHSYMPIKLMIAHFLAINERLDCLWINNENNCLNISSNNFQTPTHPVFHLDN